MTTKHSLLTALILIYPASAWAQADDPETSPAPARPAEEVTEAQQAPAEDTPTEDTPTEDAPTEDAPTEDEPTEDEPEETPTSEESADDPAATSEPDGASEEEGDEEPPESDSEVDTDDETAGAQVDADDETAGAQIDADEVSAEATEATEPKPRRPKEGSIPDLKGADVPSQRSPIGLEPGAPQATSIAGGVTPAFGERPVSGSDWAFDVHGYLQLPLRVGLNKRETALEGQKVTVLHTPPVLPGALETFEYTGTVPDPWAQLNFSMGNRDVTATVIIAARTVSNANGYYNPADQLGINDAFLTFHPDTKGSSKFNVHIGAFANRYGIMGEYDMGRFGTPLIARISGVGATGTGTFDLGPMDLTVEVGLMGPLTKAPVGVEPAGWNGFTDPNAGTTFAMHGHGALGLTEQLTVGVHAIHAFAQDDRATTTTQKDGTIDVLGLDGRLSMKRFGHLYAGYAFTNASTARSVSGVVRVLNAPGGMGLMEEYFGSQSEGSGRLQTFGAEYDLSVGNLLRHPEPYAGDAPDLVLSAFTIGTVVDTPDPEYDGVFKLKYGGEATYSFLPWMGAGLRYDCVIPDTNDATQTHAILSPRLIFKSDWASNDQVMLQYSRYFYGSNSAPVVGYPPVKDATVVPDDDVFTLSASIWW